MAHEIAQDLRRRPVLGMAGLEELLAKFTFDSDPESGILAHAESVPNGYTSSPALSVSCADFVVDSCDGALGRVDGTGRAAGPLPEDAASDETRWCRPTAHIWLSRLSLLFCENGLPDDWLRHVLWLALPPEWHLVPLFVFTRPPTDQGAHHHRVLLRCQGCSTDEARQQCPRSRSRLIGIIISCGQIKSRP